MVESVPFVQVGHSTFVMFLKLRSRVHEEARYGSFFVLFGGKVGLSGVVSTEEELHSILFLGLQFISRSTYSTRTAMADCQTLFEISTDLGSEITVSSGRSGNG